MARMYLNKCDRPWQFHVMNLSDKTTEYPTSHLYQAPQKCLIKIQTREGYKAVKVQFSIAYCVPSVWVKGQLCDTLKNTRLK